MSEAETTSGRAASTTASLRFGLRVHVVDLAAVAVFDCAAAQLHGGRQGAVVGSEFFGDQENSFQLFEAGEVAGSRLRRCLRRALAPLGSQPVQRVR